MIKDDFWVVSINPGFHFLPDPKTMVLIYRQLSVPFVWIHQVRLKEKEYVTIQQVEMSTQEFYRIFSCIFIVGSRMDLSADMEAI